MEKFSTGAVRDNQKGKPRPDLLDIAFVIDLDFWWALFAYGYILKSTKDTLFFQLANVTPTTEIRDIRDIAGYIATLEYYDYEYAAHQFVPPELLIRVARVLANGAEKYGDNNWQAGIPLGRMKASILRHYLQWLVGDTTEDHFAHLMCNLMFLHYYIREGIICDT